MRKSNFLMAVVCSISLIGIGSVALANDSFYNQGTALLMQGKCKEALSYFNASIGKGTKFIAAYINRGVCWAHLGYYQKAMDDFNSALKLDPADHTALVNRAGVYAKIGKFDDGIKDLDKVADQEYKAKSVHLAKTYFTRALLYHQSQKFEQCANDCKRVIAISSANESMRKSADALIKWCSVEEVVKDLVKVSGYLRAKDYVKADQELERIAKNKPESVLPSKNLSMFYALQAHVALTRKDFEKASKCAEQAIKLDSSNGKAYGVLGQVCLIQRKFDEAGENLSRAIRLKERTMEAYCGRAVVRLINKRPDQALADLNDALVINPKDKNVLLLRGIASLSKSSFNQLIAAGQEAMEADGVGTDKGASGALLSYDALLLAEKKDDATNLLETCLQKSPKDKWSTQMFMFMKKQIDGEAFLKASQSGNQKTDAHACIGLMAMRSGDKDTARKEFEWCKANSDAAQTSWLLLSSELYEIPQATETAAAVGDKETADETEVPAETAVAPLPEIPKPTLEAVSP